MGTKINSVTSGGAHRKLATQFLAQAHGSHARKVGEQVHEGVRRGEERHLSLPRSGCIFNFGKWKFSVKRLPKTRIVRIECGDCRLGRQRQLVLLCRGRRTFVLRQLFESGVLVVARALQGHCSRRLLHLSARSVEPSGKSLGLGIGQAIFDLDVRPLQGVRLVKVIPKRGYDVCAKRLANSHERSGSVQNDALGGRAALSCIPNTSIPVLFRRLPAPFLKKNLNPVLNKGPQR